MKNNKCLNCSERKNCGDSVASWIFLLIGIIATISVRAVTVLADLNPIFGKMAWYLGVAGFFVFFIYKFKVDHSRAKAVRDRMLVERVKRNDKLSPEDLSIISSLLCGITSNKDRINYFVIFASSIVAILAAVYFDFFRLR